MAWVYPLEVKISCHVMHCMTLHCRPRGMQYLPGGFAGAVGAHILVSTPARLHLLACSTVSAGLCWLLAVQKRFDIFCPLKVLLELRTFEFASDITP